MRLREIWRRILRWLRAKPWFEEFFFWLWPWPKMIPDIGVTWGVTWPKMIPNIAVTVEAKAWIEDWLQSCHKGFEYGSGFSTVWLGQRVRYLTSVDHQLEWYMRVKGLLKRHRLNNVKLIYQPDLGRYPMVIKPVHDETLDFVFVDGKERVKCVQQSCSKVKPGGILILDNSEKPEYDELLKSWRRYDFPERDRTGTGTRTYQTSIWIKPELEMEYIG